jgi:hypothetical protein
LLNFGRSVKELPATASEINYPSRMMIELITPQASTTPPPTGTSPTVGASTAPIAP